MVEGIPAAEVQKNGRMEIFMAKHVKRSVAPIYLVGVVWLVFGTMLSLCKPMDYVLCAVVSAAAFLVAKALCPDKTYTLPGEEEAKEKPKVHLTLTMVLCFIFEFCIRWDINIFNSRYGIYLQERFNTPSKSFS